MGLFNTLNIGYSGLNASQTALSVVGNNISNADNESYTRQKVILEPQTPMHKSPGDFGNGTKVANIVRIHDEFIYDRLKTSNGNLEYHQFSKETLEELTSYFPDLQDSGIAKDLKNYFNAWNDISSNPQDAAQKIVLAQHVSSMSRNLSDTRGRLQNMQDVMDQQIKTGIDEVNRVGEELANLNKEIAKVESVEGNHANDLRDQRDKLEMTLSKLMDISVFKGDMKSESVHDRSLTDQGREYYLNVQGHNLVDGGTFHPLKVENKYNNEKFYSIYHVDESYNKVDLTDKIKGGKIGAMLELRGTMYNKDTQMPANGKIQEYINDLDTFAKNFIQNTNSIYAQSAKNNLNSTELQDLQDNSKISDYDNINKGSFDVVIYDNEGNEVARKAITIDHTTSMNDGTDTSIVGQFNKNSDDNGDNDGTNDVDDFFTANYISNTLVISPQDNSGKYKIAIEDNGTNFAGVTGVNQLISGDNAKNIQLKPGFRDDPSKIEAFKAPILGNNEVANDMIQLQYNTVNFKRENDTEVLETFEGFYKFVTSNIASDAESSGSSFQTASALQVTINNEYQSVSGVNIDEELISLMKYQTAYQANAKVITAVDRMVDTLLGMK